MNQTAPFDRESLFLSVILLLLVVLITGGMGVYVLSDPGIGQAYVFAKAAVTIAEQCEYEASESDLIASARQAMFEQLDKYSGYVDSDQFGRIDEEFSGHYSGIGVTVIRHEQGLLIMSVRENGPAGKIGLLSGDVIIGADSIELAGISPDSATSLLRGEEGSKVLVRVFRPVTADTVEVAIIRQSIPFMHVPYAGYAPDSVLYIRLLDFEAGATADVKAALDSLIIKPDLRPQGLILDLRGNPGGLFAEAYKTANLFLEDGVFIVGTDSRSRWNEKKHYASGKDMTNGLPVAVIVDRGSASSAEIVTGALKQAGRAILVGDTTFGKGLVQGYVRFPDGDGLRLTIARYYFKNNLYLNDFDSTLNDSGHGLVPDYYFLSDRTHPFPRALENSLLLQQFADRYQDKIIEAAENGYFEDSWVDKFAAYAKQNSFVYKSSVTKLAELFGELTNNPHSSPNTKAAAIKVLQTATRDDQNQFHVYAGFIETRLKQIAFERKFGTHRAYRDVIVQELPVIRFASEILLRK